VTLGITDEAGQVNEVFAAISIGIMVDCGAHIVLVGDPGQLPPTVQSGCHPDVLSFSRFAYYDEKIESGLIAPLQDRPIVNGLPWVKHRPLDNGRLDHVAKQQGKDVDEFMGEICDLRAEGAMPGDVSRVLMIDNPRADSASAIKSGCADLHGAATCLEVVRALGPAMLNFEPTVEVIAPNAAQRTVPCGGWPQGKSGFWKNAALAESKQ
ncbi:unnamed protein product, partial [Prorocentrum cordatum]